MPTTYDITEVVRRTGISSATLRYYERERLIKPVGRHGLKRVYQTDIITRLALILLAKQSHFSLAEISDLLDNLDNGLDRAFIGLKIDEIERSMLELKKLKDSLMHIKNCPEINHFNCTNFQTILTHTLSENQTKAP